jgi:hypothetical protein
MSEEETAAIAEETTEETVEVESDIEEVAQQADKPDAVRRALQAERESAKEAKARAEELAAKVKEFEDRDKSEQEKLEERAALAETKAATLEAKMLRLEVAGAKKLPQELADRLQGETKEDLEADADRLLDLVKTEAPAVDVDAGKGTAAEATSMNDLLRSRAGVR